MKSLLSLLSEIRYRFDRAAPIGLFCALFAGIVFSVNGLKDGSEDMSFCAISLFCAVGASVIPAMIFGIDDPVITEYDEKIIKTGFGSFGKKRRIVTDAVQLMHGGRDNDALELLGELGEMCSREKERGVTDFYTSICYRRMGYPTNAGHAAARAAEAGVMRNEAMLMAARSFNEAKSNTEAIKYYEELILEAEKNRIFPFIFNEAGWEYVAADKPESAEGCFKRSMEYGVEMGSAYGGMALVCIMEQKPEEACDWYRLALLSDIPGLERYRRYSWEICTACGYPGDFFERDLTDRSRRADNVQR